MASCRARGTAQPPARRLCLRQDRPSRPIALQSPAGQRVICASVYLLVFIQNLLMHIVEKILLIQPLTFEGDYRDKPPASSRSASANLLMIRQTCAELGVHIVRGVLARDHVHMFLSIPPKLSPSDVMQRIKGRSSRRIQMEFPKLRKRYPGPQILGTRLLPYHIWQRNRRHHHAVPGATFHQMMLPASAGSLSLVWATPSVDCLRLLLLGTRRRGPAIYSRSPNSDHGHCTNNQWYR